MERMKILLILVLAVVIVSGCVKIQANLPPNATAKDVVPQNIDGYAKVNTNELVVTAGSIAVEVIVGATTENIYAGYVASQVTSGVIRCYQDLGATDSGGYYKITDPRYGGFVAAIDKNQITNPETLWGCIEKQIPPFSVIGKEFNPCAERFPIETPYNKFWVIMIGTDQSVCETFCDNMPACPAGY